MDIIGSGDSDVAKDSISTGRAAPGVNILRIGDYIDVAVDWDDVVDVMVGCDGSLR